ncbi:sensor histidine kinase [Acutalibacter muris]|jgi:sensor histidine kinase YesM|uniref:sensor histidine kinase n=1 Tax=Acutalibacter muris TaxID=1796620 RepID=UPI0026F3EEC0|nr:histidine kinase [Acutalibacter muris]
MRSLYKNQLGGTYGDNRQRRADARLAAATSIHIAGGEEVGTIHEYLQLLDKNCIDIVQPDLSRCGGLTVARKLADICERRRVTVARSFNAMLDSVQENQILRRQAQLNALQKQIDPHFLFNTLEAVKALAIRQDTQAVCSALQSLGDMFRYNTNRDNSSVTTLQSELRHIRNYLLIQRLRFGERLCYEIQAQEELLECSTLKFILQPIVENSIRYAMEPMECSYLLRITVRAQGEDVLIEISDNGPGIERERLERLRRFIENEGEQGDFGIGMKNIAQRLRLHFPGPYGLTIDSGEGMGTTVRLLFPKRVE